MKYCIVLTNKWTGVDVHLGGQYESHEKAQEFLDNDNVCLRCNRYNIRKFQDGREWISKETGFEEEKMSIEQASKKMVQLQDEITKAQYAAIDILADCLSLFDVDELRAFKWQISAELDKKGETW